jgi:Rps23 Pro-64 3,4-dihydroxylase Tpa1-like proline 4-hydroxylase
MNKQFSLGSNRIINDPFPLIIYDNFLTNVDNEEIYNGILKFKNFDRNKWGGRKQIRKESNNFNLLLKYNKIIDNLYNYFNSEDTFIFFLHQFKKLSLESKYNFEFDNKFLNYDKEYKHNTFNNLIKFFFPEKKTSYLEMDFSQAEQGYFREPHHDKKTRLINFLIYFNDLEESDGGSLDIYEYKSIPDNFKTQPDEKLLIKKQSFIPKRKQLIIFLSNPISIHGVNKILSDKKRIFAYGSYTLNKNVSWKLKD